MGKVHDEEVNHLLCAAYHRRRLAKIRLGVAGRVRERNEHLARAKPTLPNVVLHDRVAAREAVLLTQALEDSPGSVALLPRTRAVRFEDFIDDAGEGGKPGPGAGMATLVAGRRRVAKHLAHR